MQVNNLEYSRLQRGGIYCIGAAFQIFLPSGSSKTLTHLTENTGGKKTLCGLSAVRNTLRSHTLACLNSPLQLVLSAGSSIWSSAQAHCLPPGMAKHRLLQPPLYTRHLLEPVVEQT